MTKFIRYYREHPAEFAEEYLGCELYPYQKEMLNKMYKNNQSYYKW
jgi:DNA replication protein DnaD